MKINHPVKSALIAPILQEKHKECCCRADHGERYSAARLKAISSEVQYCQEVVGQGWLNILRNPHVQAADTITGHPRRETWTELPRYVEKYINEDAFARRAKRAPSHLVHGTSRVDVVANQFEQFDPLGVDVTHVVVVAFRHGSTPKLVLGDGNDGSAFQRTFFFVTGTH